MKYLTTIIILLFAISAYGQNAIITTENANLRTNPLKTAEIINTLNKGTIIKLLKADNFDGWYFVEYRNQKGWIHKSMIEIIVMKLTVPTVKGDYYFTEWRTVLSNETQSYEINHSKMKNRGEYISLWVKVITNEFYQLDYHDIDCKENKFRFRGEIKYGKNDEILESTSYPITIAKFNQIESGTIMEEIKERACHVKLDGISFSSLSPALPKPQHPTRISKGVVNGSAVNLPPPNYPLEAREAKAKGSVNVVIVIDTSGKVISARAISGHPLLRKAAEDAAYKAEFKPMIVDGEQVEVAGAVVYNFDKLN